MSLDSATEIVFNRIRWSGGLSLRAVREGLGRAIAEGHLAAVEANGRALHRLQWARISPDGPGLHSPKRPGDVGWDLEAAETVTLNPGRQVDIPTNVRVKLPPDRWGEIRARSSIARMHLQVDSGVIDNGYTGPLLVLLRNMSSTMVTISQGQRIAQPVLHEACWHDGEEVPHIEDDPRRGGAGFGSTGS